MATWVPFDATAVAIRLLSRCVLGEAVAETCEMEHEGLTGPGPSATRYILVIKELQGLALLDKGNALDREKAFALAERMSIYWIAEMERLKP